MAVFVFRLTDHHRHVHVRYQVTEWVTDGQSLLVEQVLTDDVKCTTVFHLSLDELHADDLIHVVVEL